MCVFLIFFEIGVTKMGDILLILPFAEYDLLKKCFYIPIAVISASVNSDDDILIAFVPGIVRPMKLTPPYHPMR